MNRNVYITPGDTISIQVRGLGEVYRVEADWSAEHGIIDVIVSARGGSHVDFSSYDLDEHPGDEVFNVLDPESSDPTWGPVGTEVAVTREEAHDLYEGSVTMSDLLE